jgi:hypothetical protein
MQHVKKYHVGPRETKLIHNYYYFDSEQLIHRVTSFKRRDRSASRLSTQRYRILTINQLNNVISPGFVFETPL